MFKKKKKVNEEESSASGAVSGATGTVSTVPISFLENWRSRSKRMTLDDWFKLSFVFPVIMKNTRLGIASEIASVQQNNECALCRTSGEPWAPLAWRKVSGYQLPVCRQCYLDRHGHLLKPAPWLRMMHCSFSGSSLDSSGSSRGGTGGTKEILLEYSEGTNHPQELLRYYESIVRHELLGNGFQYNSSHVSVLLAIVPEVALVVERVLPKLTLNTPQQMEEGVKHIIKTASLFVYAKK